MNRFTKVAPDKQIHLLMIRYNILRRLSSLVRNVLTTRWSLLEGNFCISKAVSHNLTSYKNNKSRCFALQVALSHLDHFLSVVRRKKHNTEVFILHFFWQQESTWCSFCLSFWISSWVFPKSCLSFFTDCLSFLTKSIFFANIGGEMLLFAWFAGNFSPTLS